MRKEIFYLIDKVKRHFKRTPDEADISSSVPEVYPDYYIWHDPGFSGHKALRRKNGGPLCISIEEYERAVANRAKQIEELEKRKKGCFFK